MSDRLEHKLSEALNERLFREKVVPFLLDEARKKGLTPHPSEHPTMVMVGGQPGAGKSKSMGAVESEFRGRGGVLTIAADDLRDFHPKNTLLMLANDRTAADYTHADASRWAEKAEAYARAHRYNVLLEGTLKTPESTLQRLGEYREAGYTTEVRIVATDQRLSWQNVIGRYERQKLDSVKMGYPEPGVGRKLDNMADATVFSDETTMFSKFSKKGFPTPAQRKFLTAEQRNFRTTNTQPANWRDYWDRLLKLNRETDSNFTIEQLWETLGTTPEEITDLEKTLRLVIGDDEINNYEGATDTIKAWIGNLISEIYIEDEINCSPSYRPPPNDRQRLAGLEALMSVSIGDKAQLKIGDLAATIASEIKYITLLRASHGAERIERDHDQTYRPELYVKNDDHNPGED